MQPCRTCGCIKPLTEFQFRNDSKKYRTECEKCRASHIAAARYRTTVGEVETLKAKQSNRCAICGKHATDLKHKSFKHNPLVIDHDHETGKVRGLLCPKCNLVIGNAEDDIIILERAVKYLQGQLP